MMLLVSYHCEAHGFLYTYFSCTSHAAYHVGERIQHEDKTGKAELSVP